MNARIDDPLPTRRSLLSRLRNLDDQESWRTFFDRYWRLLYNVARRSGLDDRGAQEVVQDTVIAVARQMPDFRYDPAQGTFKQWLLRITRRRIVDHLRSRYRESLRFEPDPEAAPEVSATPEAWMDPAPELIQRAWQEEWEQWVFDTAVSRVRSQVNPKHFQVFDYCVLKGMPISKVAATLNMNAAHIYLAKHRVSQAVKRMARQVQDEEPQDDWTAGSRP
jgi:RNA polymerase sigma-70 factor (ECF subfamily)